ncbi:hypothetical protein Tco_0756711 [Tanacetum coccineum]
MSKWPMMEGLTAKKAEFKVTFPRNYVGTNQAARKHPEPSWLNAILDEEEVAYDGGCCSKKKTWSIA